MQSLFGEESDPEKSSTNQKEIKMAKDILIKQEVVSEDESSSSTHMVYQKPTAQSVQKKRKVCMILIFSEEFILLVFVHVMEQSIII